LIKSYKKQKKTLQRWRFRSVANLQKRNWLQQIVMKRSLWHKLIVHCLFVHQFSEELSFSSLYLQSLRFGESFVADVRKIREETTYELLCVKDFARSQFVGVNSSKWASGFRQLRESSSAYAHFVPLRLQLEKHLCQRQAKKVQMEWSSSMQTKSSFRQCF